MNLEDTCHANKEEHIYQSNEINPSFIFWILIWSKMNENIEIVTTVRKLEFHKVCPSILKQIFPLCLYKS